MAEVTFVQEQIIKDVNGRIMQDLAAAIKQIAYVMVFNALNEAEKRQAEKEKRKKCEKK